KTGLDIHRYICSDLLGTAPLAERRECAAPTPAVCSLRTLLAAEGFDFSLQPHQTAAVPAELAEDQQDIAQPDREKRFDPILGRFVSEAVGDIADEAADEEEAGTYHPDDAQHVEGVLRGFHKSRLFPRKRRIATLLLRIVSPCGPLRHRSQGAA